MLLPQSADCDSACLPRLSQEEELDLIFEMCDVDQNGTITITELAAFCIKHKSVAQSVGIMPKDISEERRQRHRVDLLFEEMDVDQSGSISRTEFYSFVW